MIKPFGIATLQFGRRQPRRFRAITHHHQHPPSTRADHSCHIPVSRYSGECERGSVLSQKVSHRRGRCANVFRRWTTSRWTKRPTPLERPRRRCEPCCERESSMDESSRGEAVSSGFRVAKVSTSFFPRTAVWTDTAGDPSALRDRSSGLEPSPSPPPFRRRRKTRRIPEPTTCLHLPPRRQPPLLGTTRSMLSQRVG